MDLNEDSDAQDEEDVEMSEGSDQEEEEEEEEGDPSEFIDVLDVLDGRGEPEDEDDTGRVEKQDGPAGKDKRRGEPDVDPEGEEENMDDEDAGSRSEEEGDDDEDEDEESDHIISASEDEDVGEAALQELETFVSGLDAGQKRKVPDDDGTVDTVAASRARKRRVLPERTEAGAENEFAATGAFS